MLIVPSPFVRGRVVTSKPVDRPTPIAPVPEDYAGDNVPYRGVVDHGAPVDDNFRDPETDMPVRPDGRLVDVYEHEETHHEPIPVYIVNRSSRERRTFRSVTAYAGGTNFGARQILGQDETRTRATIRNNSLGVDLWISDTAAGATDYSGYLIKQDETYTTESQEPIYAWVNNADGMRVPIAVECRVSLDQD